MPDYNQAYVDNGECSTAVHEKELSVKVYKACRFVPQEALESFARIIHSSNPNTVLEAGVGNGRLFIPICQSANSNQQLFGLDVSQAMLNDLWIKVNQYPNVKLMRGDIRDKDSYKTVIDNGSIDVLYSFATLHILSQNWKNAFLNFDMVLSDNGRIYLGEELNSVFHGSENLYENDDFRLYELNEYWLSDDRQFLFEGTNVKADRNDIAIIEGFFREYHSLRNKYGYDFSRVNGQILHGDQSPAERFLRINLGYYQFNDKRRNALTWLKPHTIKEILFCFENGTVTTLGTDVPIGIRSKMKKDLLKWCTQNSVDTQMTMFIPAEIQMHVFMKKPLT